MESRLDQLDIINVGPLTSSLGISDDEGDGDDDFGSDLLNSTIQNSISNSLVETGTMPGLAAAAAMVTTKKKHQPYKFELNPALRKRQHTRLIRKLKQTIHELCTRCGQQAIVLCVSPGKENPSFRVFGSSPLDQVVKNCQGAIFRDLETELQAKIPPNQEQNTDHQFELPPLMVDGIPTTLEKMNQAQLRMFIPEMLKFSTGRGKPGWGKSSTRPVWWPMDVPWSNVRRDDRTEEVKLKVSWTQALRQIVKNCYRYHSRDDLLTGMACESLSMVKPRDKFSRVFNTPLSMTPPTLVQTVHNADGSVSLVQLDSGQTIATITQDQSGAAVATLANQHQVDAPMEMTIDEMESAGWPLAGQETIGDAFSVVTSEGTSHPVEQAVELTIAHSQTIATGSLTAADDVTLTNEDDSSAMVEIPVSVYEKIANSISSTGAPTTVSISPDGRILLQPSIIAHKPNKSQQQTLGGVNQGNAPSNT
uniref:DNA-binding protein P3A2-like n=1 Tax=Phallusia mammillata TaxID=59560 RepID=A0A6F9DLW7_9ASCI|nr:DNA-binding protein P3A2-like [Phallusia mammillata]